MTTSSRTLAELSLGLPGSSASHHQGSAACAKLATNMTTFITSKIQHATWM